MYCLSLQLLFSLVFCVFCGRDPEDNKKYCYNKMEIALPLLGLAGIYFINKNSSTITSTEENFETSRQPVSQLPNVDIPNKNYPNENIKNSETDTTSKLSVSNNFDSRKNYLDKFFNPNVGIKNSSEDSNIPASYTSLSGNKVDSSYFQHNNMVPFFGSNLRTNHTSNNINESTLDSMTGAGSQIFSKREQGPLFDQQSHLQHAYGTPNHNDFYQSRMNPSISMNGVKPFQDEKVGPGLGLGYGTAGSGGFNSGMAEREKWMDRDVDELRAANKPKPGGNSLYGYEGAAHSNVATSINVNNYGRFEKNRPDTAYEMGQNRLLITTGTEKGPYMNSKVIEKNMSRPETTAEYTGVAGVSNPTTYSKGEYMPSHNNQLGEIPLGVANANGRHIATEEDYGFKTKVAYPNNRSIRTKDEDYYGAVGGAIGAVVAPLLDALRPSRRENTIGSLRPYQNAKTTVSNSYVYNPNDVPDATIRETTENSINHLNVNSNQLGGAYKVALQTPITNNRMTTDNFSYVGQAGAGEGSRAKKSYEAEYNQKNNEIKSSTVVGSGYTPSGNMDLFNGNLNQSSKPKENFLKNERAVVPAPILNYDAPDKYNMGKMHGPKELYQNIQLDRTDSSFLDSLKKNPFTHDIVSAL